MRTAFLRSLLVALAAGTAAPALFAQPLAGSPAAPRFEITPFAGYRLAADTEDDLFDLSSNLEVDESSLYGLAFDVGFTDNLQLEVRATRQPSDLVLDGGIFDEREVLGEIEITHVQVGVLYQWLPGQVNPFVVGSGGVAHIDPDLPGTDAETRLAGSIGGGVKVRFNRNVGVRFEARTYATDFSADLGDDDRFDDFDNDDLLVQTEASVGLILSW